jgi:hypothetical protein
MTEPTCSKCHERPPAGIRPTPALCSVCVENLVNVLTKFNEEDRIAEAAKDEKEPQSA